ncbi:hypothetical protein [[Scytonema hofmanni] UTEX B 1581]|nr:hypothetical protein [[Scytonema hofmanni] UTEX B 1581]
MKSALKVQHHDNPHSPIQRTSPTPSASALVKGDRALLLKLW